jgi:poly-gamma-glutamate synthase PgsB/CapB
VPVRGTLFTAERGRKQLRIMERAAEDRQSEFRPVTEADLAKVTPQELQGFSYIEHPDNVALAISVCQSLGISRQTALRGMWQATPDPGAMTQWNVEQEGKRLVFVNAFAANDPQSTDCIWNLANKMNPGANTRTTIVNCRSDRPERSIQMAEMCASWKNMDTVFAIGTGTDIFVKKSLSLGISQQRLFGIERQPAEAILKKIADVSGRVGLIMGVGNIAGIGMELVDLFRSRSKPFIPTIPRKEAA